MDKIGVTRQTIDYIWYTPKIKCSRVLAITKDEIEPLHMPGWRYPSDHFFIGADLAIPPAARRRLEQNDPPRDGRRRMAQREFSSRRDSPVMTRLLEEIIDAQDD